MSNIDPRDFGALEAKVEELEKKVDSMSTKLDAVLDALNEAKGGWKFMMYAAGAAGALGAGIAWAIQHISIK